MMAIRIAIGTEKRTEIARKVLEYSIISNCKQAVEFHSFLGEDYHDRGDLGQGTGFSFLRFHTPEYFNYEGRAIYLDADMLVLSDISELWNVGDNDPENIVWCKLGNESKELAETSVMVINCDKAKNKMKTLKEIEEYLIDDIDRKKYRKIMKLQYLDPKPVEISRWWNVMDKCCVYSKINDFKSSKAKLLHFTNVRTQPWFDPKHPHSNIWEVWLKKAIKDGYISSKEIAKAVKNFDISNPRRPNGMHKKWLPK